MEVINVDKLTEEMLNAIVSKNVNINFPEKCLKERLNIKLSAVNCLMVNSRGEKTSWIKSDIPNRLELVMKMLGNFDKNGVPHQVCAAKHAAL